MRVVVFMRTRREQKWTQCPHRVDWVWGKGERGHPLASPAWPPDGLT